MVEHSDTVRALANELAFLRAQQDALRMRSAQVREALLALVDTALLEQTIVADTARVVIEKHCDKRFDATLLPDRIRQDRTYQRTSTTTVVRVLPLEEATPPRKPKARKGRQAPKLSAPPGPVPSLNVFDRFGT